MKYDEKLQLEILVAAMDASPQPWLVTADMHSRYDEAEIAGTLFYLQGHGLIKTGTRMGADNYISFGYVEITHRGIDFMRPDGGLGALINVVTVKLHEDSIKELVVDRIEKSSESETVKSEMIKQVKSLPAEGLKTLTTKALEAGLSALPSAIPLLRTWLAGQ